MSAPDTIKSLVERFERNREQYRSGRYKETQLRREFLDPFFEALGWDVFNKQGHAETYKEVIHEDSLEIEGATKAPDYAFRVGGQRKFFVEAKKPSVKIETDYYPAFQLRRYSWSAKLPLGILSDFEEFAVYDCRVKPDKKDKASVGRVMLLSYKDYVEKWDELVSIFSRDAVLKGSFDSYAEGMKTKKGTTEVDDAFLSEIERWRDLLAKNIALRNRLGVRELNYAVQMTIDRIIFLRICEDRGIERDEQLKEIASGDDIYKGLVQLFQKADARYNSGLFHFRDEKGQSSPADSLTLELSVDDKVLRDILLNLYYPESPYVFREIPSDILGQVYERFLGKVIRLTAGGQAKVEEKPEVRKAGGVYYTPTYIVNYIVQNTVGKLLEGKTPKEAARLRVLDPACGSGTFPLGAYQFLLDWHLDWYIKNNPEKLATSKNPPIFQAKDGWQLTTSKKKEILLNNIYGVDIDAQAVEVTKLSLLLKVLEGESQETIGSQLALLQERVLPDLSKNIQCGNSLIGSDYYEGRQLTMGFGDEGERYRVNAFDWKGAFPQVFIQGGFDVVVGNPPYIRTTLLEESKDYFKKSYESAVGAYDIYVLFLEKALDLIKQNGLIGFITPNKYFVADYASKIREILLTKSRLISISDLGKCKSVFEGALISTTITIYSKDIPYENIDIKILSDETVKDIAKIPFDTVPFIQIVTPEQMIRVYADVESNSILSKINKVSDTLSSVADVRTGVMGFDYWAMDKFIADDNEGIRIATNSYINRYEFLWGKKVNLYKRIVYDPKLDPSCNVLSDNTIELFNSKKIVIRGVAKRLSAMYDNEGVGMLVAVHSVIGVKHSNLFLLGLINSKLFNWIHIVQFYSARIPEGSLRYPISFLSALPVKRIDFSSSTEKTKHDNIVSMVERILDLHKQNPRTPQEQEMVRREIESTDRAIDNLVYELYGLTEEEIKIVEGRG